MNYDVFPFFNELDLLELRLTELDPVVDWFVISESDITFSGKRKPMHFHDNRKRYDRWRRKIIYHPVRNMILETKDAWRREEAYRDVLRDVIQPKPDDKITFTDADEIPHPKVYEKFDVKHGLCALDMMFLMYYLNGRVYERWAFGKIISGAYWNEVSHLNAIRFDGAPWHLWWTNGRLISPGGWHFSWLGDRTKRILKARSTAHCNDDHCHIFIQKLKKDPAPDFGPRSKSRPVEIDHRWPAALLHNRELQQKLASYCYKTGACASQP
jgi:beta-1,4-mannosyl-glycoprotein beta-1,4-N-acetylglucosaminyltransferase